MPRRFVSVWEPQGLVLFHSVKKRIWQLLVQPNSFCLQTNKVKQTITAISHAIMLTAVILFTRIIFSSAWRTTLPQDGSPKSVSHHHLNPKDSSPRRTLREEDGHYPDVITLSSYDDTCGYLPAFLSSATCSSTMYCLAFAFYFYSLSRKCYEATRIDVSCRLG